MTNGLALAGAFTQKGQRNRVAVAVGIFTADDQRMLVFVARRRILRYKLVLQPIA